MKVRSVRVQNFCAIRDETLSCDAITALVGANGAGKSSFLRALALFFGSSRGVSIEDVHNRAPDTEIRITVTFSDLSPEAATAAGIYLRDGTVSITKVINVDARPTESYHGQRLTNPEFDELRRVNATEMAKKYAALRSTTQYATLPHETTRKAILPALVQWEQDHPEACELAEDAGDFFGLEDREFAIKEHVEFVLIPAVRDASEDVSGNGYVPALLSRLARSVLLEAEATEAALGKARADVLATIQPSTNEDLLRVSGAINETLREMAPTADIRVTWTDADLELVPPLPKVEVGEEDYCTSVARSGHGVQRALVIAILQHQAAHERRAAAEGETGPKNLVLAIEEPELYQHPNRQRHLAEVLHKLATGAGAGVMDRTQVLIATHSPLFVHLDYFDSVRRAFKESPGPGAPRATRLVNVQVEALARSLAEIDGKPPEEYTADGLRARLRAVMTPWMNEGFFARKIVLVEGESDRAAIMALARNLNVSLEAEGVSVIPVNGKSLLDKPYLVFSKLKIPTFVMWDADFWPADAATEKKKEDLAKSAQENRRLLRLLGAQEEDFPEGVTKHFAVHAIDLEASLREELGEELYGKVLDDTASRFGYAKRKEVLKSTEAMSYALGVAFAAGAKLEFLPRVLDAVAAL